MFCTRVAWVCLVYLLLCKEEDSSPVSAITERRDMGMYEVLLRLCWVLGWGICLPTSIYVVLCWR